MSNRRGNCYFTSEAIFWLTGGKRGPYSPAYIKHEGDTHWYLIHKNGEILDLTVGQFKTIPDYSKGRRCGFLTSKPSNKAKALMKRLVWQEES